MALSSHSQIRKPGSCTPGHISALKHGSGTHQPRPPLSPSPPPQEGAHSGQKHCTSQIGSHTSFHHINRAATKTCSAPEAGGPQHRDNCYEQTTDQSQRPARVWGEKTRLRADAQEFALTKTNTFSVQIPRCPAVITYWGK